MNLPIRFGAYDCELFINQCLVALGAGSCIEGAR
jgi:hypothetical protein